MARAPTERCLAAQYAVSLMLVESDTLDDVMLRVLGSIGESLGWPLGVFWRVENQRTGMLRRYTTWHGPARACAEPGELMIDGELASRVWARGEPAWITCSGTPGAVLPVATGAAWYGAIAFPLQGGRQILGVMEFRGDAFHSPDPHLIQTVTALGRMIGQFILLKSLQDQVRESDKLVRDTFEQAAVGIAHAALDGRFLLINQKLLPDLEG